MREVRSCDFCGEDAAGAYEVVPAGTGVTAEARRMLLCDGCRDRLAAVVDPLLDALGDSDGFPTAPPAEGSPTEDESGDGSSTAGEPETGGQPLQGHGPPSGYRKVVRFLENRELPVDRAAAEGLVVDAYELDEEDVTAAIDHAVKHGRLRDVNGELRR